MGAPLYGVPIGCSSISIVYWMTLSQLAGSESAVTSTVLPSETQPQRPAHRQIKRPFPFGHRGDRLTGDGGFDHVAHVSDAHIPQGALRTVDGELEVRLSLDAKDARIDDALDGHELPLDLFGELGQLA